MTRAIAQHDLDHILAYTGDVWSTARGARVFLTGGTGFFGAWLAESFSHANERLGLGATLTILSRDPGAAIARVPRLGELVGVTFHTGDVRDFSFPSGSFTHVLHAAAESSQQAHAGDQRHMFDTVIDGTRRSLELARRGGVSKYLFVSSGAVYGAQPPELSHVPERFTGGPSLIAADSAYGEAKRAAEVLTAIEADRGDLSVRVARCFAFVGPHLPLDAHFAIGNFIRDAMHGGPIRIRGDGTAVRSYLYMADLAIWLWTIALGPTASGAYNVGSEQPMSILETARVVADWVTPAVDVVVEGQPNPDKAIHRYVPSTARARNELDLVQRVSVRDAVARTAAWHGFGEAPEHDDTVESRPRDGTKSRMPGLQ